jgi:hypothetical protein
VLVGREPLGGKRGGAVLIAPILAAGTSYPMAVVQQYMAAAEMGVAAAYLMEMGGNGGKITSKEVFKQVYARQLYLVKSFFLGHVKPEKERGAWKDVSTKPNLVTLIQITSKYYVSVPRTRVQYIALVLLTPSVNRDLMGGTGGTIHHGQPYVCATVQAAARSALPYSRPNFIGLNAGGKTCSQCGTNRTPQWREGPEGALTVSGICLLPCFAVPGK